MKEQNGNYKNIIILLSTVVLLLLGYLLYDSLVNDGLSQEEIVAELNDVKAEYENIQKELNKRNDNLVEKNVEVIKIQSELEVIFNKSNITEEELKKAKVLIKDLSQIAIKNYKEQITALQRANQTFEITNNEKEKIIIELKSKLNKEVIVSQKKDQLLDYASSLMASNFVLKSYKVRESGKEIETEKGSRVDRIKIFFDIPKNKIAKSGKTDLYIRIILSDGKLAILEGKNGLQFKSEDNRMIDCSEKITIDYVQGSEETVHFNWDNKDGFESGDYIFEVYQNGRLIGKASKFLR